MLHKYYICGVSNRFNLKFCSETADDGVWTMPDIRYALREAISEAMESDVELYAVLSGYKQYLYLEKSENTSRFWKVVIGVWHSKWDCDNGFDPDRVIRVTTNYLRELVRDKYTGELYQELPMSVCNNDKIRMFY